MRVSLVRTNCFFFLALPFITLSPPALGLGLDTLTKKLQAVGDTACDLVSNCGPQTSTNPDKPYPPEPTSPCGGQIIQPDSMGKYNFMVTSDGAGIYAIEFSKNGSTWNDPINAGLGLAQTSGTTVPVNAGKLLLAAKGWYWRTSIKSAQKLVPSGQACQFTIEPSGGVQSLTTPEIVSPACGGQVSGDMVLFNAKPGSTGKFEIFKAELQYNTISGWVGSGLLSEIDKLNSGSKYGVAIPLNELDQKGREWRWRVRLYNEKMPIFGNMTEAPWTPWCTFSLPGKPLTKPMTPQDSPAGGGLTAAQANAQQATTTQESAERSVSAAGESTQRAPASSGATQLPAVQSPRPTRPNDRSAMRMPTQGAPSSFPTESNCALSVPYLKPELPVIEIARSDLRQGDIFRIICRFRTDVKDLTWLNCDADTAKKVVGYREKISRSSAARYSGMLDVDGATVRVATSPPRGLGDFELEHFWVHKAPGSVAVGCKVDNLLQQYVEGSGRYLEANTSVSVGPRIEGRQAVGSADLPPRGHAARLQTPGGDSGTVDRTLNPQPEAPSTTQRGEMSSTVSEELPAVQGQGGGSGAVDPKLNPQPEVPSAKQRGATGSAVSGALPAVQGQGGGSGAVDPKLNPQPEVPSAKQRGARGPAVRSSGQQSGADGPSGGPLPEGPLADYVKPQSALTRQGEAIQNEAGVPTVVGKPIVGQMPQAMGPVGLTLECNIKGGYATVGSVKVTNTTGNRLEKGSLIKWTIYKKGVQLGWVVNTEDEALLFDETTLSQALAVGQADVVGIFKPDLGVSYYCRASVLPAASSQNAARQSQP